MNPDELSNPIKHVVEEETGERTIYESKPNPESMEELTLKASNTRMLYAIYLRLGDLGRVLESINNKLGDNREAEGTPPE